MTASVTPLPSGSNPTEEQWGIKPGAKSASQRRDIGLLVAAACKGAPSLQLSTAQSTQQAALQGMAKASAADRVKANEAGAGSKEKAEQLRRELTGPAMPHALERCAYSIFSDQLGHSLKSSLLSKGVEASLLTAHELRVSELERAHNPIQSACTEVAVTTVAAKLLVRLLPIGEGPAGGIVATIPVLEAAGKLGDDYFHGLSQQRYDRLRRSVFTLDPEGIPLDAVREGCKMIQAPAQVLHAVEHAVEQTVHATTETIKSIQATMEKLPPYK